MDPSSSTVDPWRAVSVRPQSALRVTALVCVVSGLALAAVGMGLVSATENTTHRLYGRSISQIPMGQWPPSTWIYCSVWVLGAAVTVAGVTCAVVCVVRARRSAEAS